MEEACEFIKQGAEAKLYKTVYLGQPTIIKERVRKEYRNKYLDDSILKERMKAEAKGLLKSKVAGVHSPALYLVDMETRKLYMEYIAGVTAKEFIDELLSQGPQGKSALDQLAARLGACVASMHLENLVHGDLTTSNFLIQKDTKEIYVIDFGLSYISQSTEDKGVDLYVLERALMSTHDCAEKFFEDLLKSYVLKTIDAAGKGEEILKKYKIIKARGRKRTMVG